VEETSKVRENKTLTNKVMKVGVLLPDKRTYGTRGGRYKLEESGDGNIHNDPTTYSRP
jgi:hypothetical protein